MDNDASMPSVVAVSASAINLHIDTSSDAALPTTPSEPLSPVLIVPAPAVTTARIVVLTLNDVYELFPNANGQGGVAEFATLLRETRARLSPDAHVIVTLNGDFLWRSELDREDKGALMIDVLNALGVDFVVVGNHEFDFGGALLAQLLTRATFTSFGSNVRQRNASDEPEVSSTDTTTTSTTTTTELFPGLVDYTVMTLPSGLKLGLFGVSTTATGKDLFAGAGVVFESEVAHARRCVAALQTAGADVVIALTHLKVADDKLLAAQVPGIHAILGGHDHEPMTVFSNDTLIHKSGQDALWLGVVVIDVIKTDATYDQTSCTIDVEFQWHMLCNRAHTPDATLHALLSAYDSRVHAQLLAQGKLTPLAIARTALDGTRASCRTHETNVGNMVADALRTQLCADVAVLNAGFIKGDARHDAGCEITASWLETYLPLRKPAIVVELSTTDLARALTRMLRKYPQMSSSFPQIAGFAARYDAETQQVTLLRIPSCGDDNVNGDDDDDKSRMLKVATVLVPSMDGWEVFERAPRLITMESVPVRELVAAFVSTHKGGEIAYPPSEDRLVIEC